MSGFTNERLYVDMWPAASSASTHNQQSQRKLKHERRRPELKTNGER